jgi:signal transduction histidine kinase
MAHLAKGFLFALFCCMFFSFSHAEENVPFIRYVGKSDGYVGRHLGIFSDSSAKMNVRDVLLLNRFKNTSQPVPNLDITPYRHWIRVAVKNLSRDEKVLFHLAQPVLDEVEFYSLDADGSPVSLQKVGDKYPFRNRKFLHQDFVFEVHIPQGSIREFVFSIRSGEQIMVPLSLDSPTSVWEKLMRKDLIFGIYAGIILVMFFYNLFLFFSIRDRSYLYYVIYILSVGFTQASLQGYSFRIFLPDQPVIANFNVYLFSALIGITALAFLREFLQTRIHAPRLHHGVYVFYAVYGATIVLATAGLFNLSYKIILMSAMTSAVYAYVVAITVARKGSRPARFFLFAWTVFILGVVSFVLKDFNVLPFNDFTSNALVYGSALETILLSTALADKFNALKKEKEFTQQQALDTMKENQRIIREQNVILEEKVKERTIELESANSELHLTFENLKQTQAQLVNAEKMASLGQLTAGIAHEINNPINYVASNVRPLRRDIEDLMGILARYERISDMDSLSDEDMRKYLLEAKLEARSMDVDYLCKEMTMLLDGIEDGAKRTTEIVKGLKTFSRLDEAELKYADLNSCLDSTLALLKNMMDNKILVVRNFGELPKVECQVGKMNQVFMNILVNAIQAVMASEVYHKGKAEIIVTTCLLENDVRIEIRDNGKGMPESVRQKIFEPFFTTKDVGEGTGLGLSIVYQIMESHHGRIEVWSEEGEGSSFSLVIPIKYAS